MALICGFAAVLGTAAPAGAAASAPCTATSTSACAVSLTMSSGSYQTQAPPPTDFPAQSSPAVSATYDPSTGVLSDGTLTLPPVDNICTGEGCINIKWYETTPGSATGSVDDQGNVTLSDSLTLEADVTSPLAAQCPTSPVTVTLTSSAPYDPSVGAVTLSNASSFAIPDFPSTTTCGSAVASGLNAPSGGIAGSTGNELTLDLSGTPMPLPPPPGKATTTVLSISPASGNISGQTTTLSATVASGGMTATNSTGTVDFTDGSTDLGTAPVVAGTGTATLSTSTLPSGSHSLRATYSGDTQYQGSTSSPASYVLTAPPTFTAALPTSYILGAAPAQFSGTLTDPVDGTALSNARLDFTFTFSGAQTQPQDVDLESCTDATYTTCTPIALTGSWTGSYGGTTGFSLNPGDQRTLYLELSAKDFPVPIFHSTGTMAVTTDVDTVDPASGDIQSTLSSASGTISLLLSSQTPTTTTLAATFTATQLHGLPMAVNFQVSPSDASPYTEPVSVVLDGQTIEQYWPGGPGKPTYLVSGQLTLDTVDWSVGTHLLTVVYPGDAWHTASTSVPLVVTILADTGTLYTCAGTGIGYSTAYLDLSAQANMAGSALAGSDVALSGLNVTGTMGVATPAYEPPYGPGLEQVTSGFSPSGSGAGPDGTTSAITSGPLVGQSDVTVSFFGGSGTTSIAADAQPGTAVPVGLSSLEFQQPDNLSGGTTMDDYDCTPVGQPAVLGTVTVAGTTLSLDPSGAAPAGTPVTLSAAVSPPSATGFVQFADGTTVLGSAQVAGGAATFVVNDPTVGDHAYTASYTGDLLNPPSTSNTVDYQVGTTTTTTLASSANPANAADPVAFTATVSPPLGALTQPTGDVSFTTDGNPIASCQDVALSMDSPPTATCATSFGAGESHVIVATYSGDDTYLGSSADPLTQTTLPGTNTTILSTKDPSPPGKVTFWAGVSPSSGTGATPTGTVAFTIDGSIYKPCNAQPLGPGGGASCTVSFRAGTTHKVSATYPGSATYSGSSSSTITQTVTGSSGSTGPRDTDGSATLAPGKSLTADQQLSSASYRLVMQGDGNLVEYQGSKALWASHTAGHPGAGVVMQKDGNLVEYFHGHAVWASHTAGHPGAHLTLQATDGNVVIYQGATALWSTGT